MSPIRQLVSVPLKCRFTRFRGRHGSKRRQHVSLRWVLGPRWDGARLLLQNQGLVGLDTIVELWWQVQDSNLRRRKPTDLQSAPIGRSGNLPGCCTTP